MEPVDVTYAKEHLEQLLDRAAKGEDVLIVHPQAGSFRLAPQHGHAGRTISFPKRQIGLYSQMAEISEERLLAPLSEDELAWLSGEQSEVE
jgi:antitoxin (DNA-binding transcriptional repressor) of toxin-antitoxin stability system